jgi:hypothetical protein
MAAMATVKFKLMLKEVSFEFDGDRDSGAQILASLSRSLDTVSDLQKKIVDVDTIKSGSARGLLTAGNVTRRRLGRNSSSAIETSAVPVTAVRRRRKKKPIGPSIAQHISVLLEHNYFSSPRSLGDIKSELAKKGITVEQHQLSSPLLYMTKRKKIARSNESGKWLYFATEKTHNNARQVKVIKRAAA